MEIKEREYVLRNKVVGYRCDNCEEAEVDRDTAIKEWISIVLSHSEWDNDSCDSVQEFNFCSIKCLIEYLPALDCDYDDHRSSEVGLLSYHNLKKLIAYKGD